MLTDHWAHHYYENPKAAEEIEDADFDLAEELAKAEAEAEDVDDWEDISSDDN